MLNERNLFLNSEPISNISQFTKKETNKQNKNSFNEPKRQYTCKLSQIHFHPRVKSFRTFNKIISQKINRKTTYHLFSKNSNQKVQNFYISLNASLLISPKSLLSKNKDVYCIYSIREALRGLRRQ